MAKDEINKGVNFMLSVFQTNIINQKQTKVSRILILFDRHK